VETQNQNLVPMSGIDGSAIMVNNTEINQPDLGLAEMELALDPGLVQQLNEIDAAFDTTDGRKAEMELAATIKKKDGFTQGGWARG